MLTLNSIVSPDPTFRQPKLPSHDPFTLRCGRVRAAGKFFEVCGTRFEPRGVTYGTFEPNADGHPYPSRDTVSRDLDAMTAAGFNTVRTYTIPPEWMLDMLLARGMYAFVGVPWEQHVAVVDDPGRQRQIEASVRAQVARCAGHSALFAVAVGNEIPAPIVRWSGRKRIERFLARLYEAAKDVDPHGLVTYVNFPTTEYLRLPFLDFAAFNVYLDSRSDYEPYLARLHNRAGALPLVMAEIGFDGSDSGRDRQASRLRSLVQGSLRAGCAGLFVFSWTDEWHRGGAQVTGWRFGLTTQDREPKPALAAVRQAIADHPTPPEGGWPSISVVVCAYQAADTIERCLRGLSRLQYPDFEVLLIDDGSTDGTGSQAHRAIADIRARNVSDFNVRVLRTENRGLSRARNTGIQEARGDIVAFLDADAWPDEGWLRQLAYAFTTGRHAGVGGPNLAPPDSGWVGTCVSNAPGGPVHVLQTDEIAEHVPGCNMAFRRDALAAVSGFDPRFRIAGDDVDLCWRIQARGWTVGFSPAAVVWHLPRATVRAYWRQQVGYGAAEALLEGKWPEKYNEIGHVTWGGRIYGAGIVSLPFRRARIYSGTWGQAPFQQDQGDRSNFLWDASAMPEWYLGSLLLAILGLLGPFWPPLAAMTGLSAIAVAIPLLRSIEGARAARFPAPSTNRWEELRRRTVCGILHLVQPLARLRGRYLHGLVPWRRRARVGGFLMPRERRFKFWRELGLEPRLILEALESRIAEGGTSVRRDSGWDDWDLEVHGGLGGGARLLSCVEWHGGPKQLCRFSVTPRVTLTTWTLMATGLLLALAAARDRAPGVSILIAFLAALVWLRAIWESGLASAAIIESLENGFANGAVPEVERSVVPAPLANGERHAAITLANHQKSEWTIGEEHALAPLPTGPAPAMANPLPQPIAYVTDGRSRRPVVAHPATDFEAAARR